MTEKSLIYILCSLADYETAMHQGTYQPESLETEGFIHASPAEKLTRVANKYYQDKKDLQLLYINPERVTSQILWEPISNGDLYPHIYGPLNVDAVTMHRLIRPKEDGTFEIRPEDL
jgi:uncharacterized protein (DUF952 family)